MSDDNSSTRRGPLGRLYHGETAIDFYGRRHYGFIVSGALVVITAISLFFSGLELGIDFEGGVAWQVPASPTLDSEVARSVVAQNGVEMANAKVQTLKSGELESIRIQVGDQSSEVRSAVQAALAVAAGVDINEVSVSSVSSSWGRTITEKGVRALVVFLILVSLYIAWRFEWRMALAAIMAMLHDVLISSGIYSLFGLEVTPATVVAFLTILGFSLYDTIVVFDKVKDNMERFSASRTGIADIVNVSMNQVLMRSLNTSLAAVLPVISLLAVGSGVFGAVALREFAVALLVGLLIGSYSSIFVASPLLTVFKERESHFRNLRGLHASGAELEHMVVTGNATGSKKVRRQTEVDTGSSQASPVAPGSPLTHPPRPRKKRRR
ncbi:MAG: protein translocase subunit SecF [Actinobacteria bacterium]|nr:protein translocase subunit SecF [Actinomycetota bacterium]